MFDWIRECCTNMEAAKHCIPFAALFAKEAVPANRPMATRLIEQSVVGVVSGLSAGFGAIYVNQIKQEEQLKHLTAIQAQHLTFQNAQMAALKAALQESEQRLTMQITELRARQLK